ncbi:MAG: alginate export family protein, partial [Phenylobacterium sp.]
NGYTGVRADLRLADRTSATAFYTLPQQRRPEAPADLRDNRFKLDREDASQRLYGAYLSRPFPAGGLVEVGYVRFQESDRPDRPTRDRDLHSVSARVITEPRAGRLDYEVELIRQTGHVRSSLQDNAPIQDVSAGFIHWDAGYTFEHPWRPRLSLEYDHATGDGPGGRYSRFDTLFGMRRADLAPAGLYAALGRTNLETAGFRIEAAPSRRLDVFASGRALWADNARDSFSTTGVRDPTGSAGRFAGYQVEGRVRYWIRPESLRAELNAAVLKKDGLLAAAPNANPYGDTRYVSLALTASF